MKSFGDVTAMLVNGGKTHFKDDTALAFYTESISRKLNDALRALAKGIEYFHKWLDVETARLKG